MGKIYKIINCLESNRDEKRTSNIETSQLENLKYVIGNMQEKYEKHGIIFHCELNTRKKNKTFFLTNDGVLTNVKKLKNLHCTKSFDAYITITYKNEIIKLFCVLKGVPNRGGAQDNQIRECISASDLMRKNKDDNIFFLFLLDGEYVNSKINEFEKSDKYFFSESEDLFLNIDKFIVNNFNLF